MTIAPDELELCLEDDVTLMICGDNYHHDKVRIDVYDFAPRESQHVVVRLDSTQACRLAISILRWAELVDPEKTKP